MDKNFNRLDYYYDYFRNVSPNTFSVKKEGDSIVISNITPKSNKILDLLRKGLLENSTITR
jgi:hypothetical protein